MINTDNLIITIGIFCASVLLLFCTGFFIMYFQAKRLKEVHCKVESDVDGEDRQKIALISDLHFPLFPVRKSEVIRRISASAPDCVMIAGDLCQNRAGKCQLYTFLTELSAAVSVPIYIVLGNHDIADVCNFEKNKIEAYSASIEQCGVNIKVLRNEAVVLEGHGTLNRLLIGGLDDYQTTDKSVIAPLVGNWNNMAKQSDCRLVILAHNPDALTVMPEKSCSILLCGHTHGGQVYMPFNIEFTLLRHDSLPKKGYKYGMLEYKKNKVYITCGLGCSFLPIRFMTAAEIAYIYL